MRQFHAVKRPFFVMGLFLLALTGLVLFNPNAIANPKQPQDGKSAASACEAIVVGLTGDAAAKTTKGVISKLNTTEAKSLHLGSVLAFVEMSDENEFYEWAAARRAEGKLNRREFYAQELHAGWVDVRMDLRSIQSIGDLPEVRTIFFDQPGFKDSVSLPDLFRMTPDERLLYFEHPEFRAAVNLEHLFRMPDELRRFAVAEALSRTPYPGMVELKMEFDGSRGINTMIRKISRILIQYGGVQRVKPLEEEGAYRVLLHLDRYSYAMFLFNVPEVTALSMDQGNWD